MKLNFCFRPLSGNHYFKYGRWADGYYVRSGFRPLSGNHYFKLYWCCCDCDCGDYRFRPLSGNHYFKWELERMWEETFVRVSVPYRGIIISNGRKINRGTELQGFPSPIGESLFQIIK